MKFSSNANNSTLDSTFYLNTNNAASNVNVNISVGISRGIDFLGFRFFNRYTLIRKRIARSFIRACKEFVATTSHAELARVISYYGWVKAADGYNLWRSYKSRVESAIPIEYDTNTKLIKGRL